MFRTHRGIAGVVFALIGCAALGCSSGSEAGSTAGGGTVGGGMASTGQGGAGAGPITSSSAATTGAGAAGGAGGGPMAVPLTLLTLNLHCFQLGGTSFASNADRFAAITAFATARDVDVMTVQEACVRPGEDAIEILRAGLSQATGQKWSSVWALAHLAWEGTPDEANEGVGLLVRGDAWNEVSIDHAVQSALHRVAASARLPIKLGGARVMSVHFDVFDAGARSAQAREAAAVALADAEPALDAIVAGDFNAIENSPAWSAFPAMGYIPANKGLDAAGIDHVMIHRAAPLRPTLVEKVLTGADAVSDHPGVLVRFEPAAGDAVTVTRIFTGVDPGLGSFLSVRGSSAPLSWNYGFPMRRRSPDERVLISTELQGPFSFKLLRDDTDWQVGPDEMGSAGSDHVVTPTF